MKFITGLALKYVKRQKFRTILTFLGVMLASFIMSMSLVVLNSVFESFKNNVFSVHGTWEVNLTSALGKSDNSREALEKISQNATVDQLYCTYGSLLIPTEDYKDAGDGNCFIIECDEKYEYNALNLGIFAESENNGMLPDEETANFVKSDKGVCVPGYLKKDGYKKGDTVKLSVTPVKDGKRGVTCSDEFVIESFINTDRYEYFTMSVSVSNRFAETIYEQNKDFIYEKRDFAGGYVRMKDNVRFEESVRQLLSDVFGDSYEYEDLISSKLLNDTVLLLKMKALISPDLFSLIIPFVVLFLFLIWLTARFIIDNTFEISVAERNRKYSVLRTFGASKGQLAALTLTEAAFYCLTAVPAGIVASYFTVYSIFDSFIRSGVEQFVFKVHPIMIVASAVLCVLSVMISSFTSALWPTRKMTLVDAMNYGISPKRKKKVNIKNKKTSVRKLHKTPGKFMWAYTKRNIGRTKGKFFFSAFAGSVSVIMLIVTVMSSVVIRDALKAPDDNSTVIDYTFKYINNISYSDITDYFGNSDIFSTVEFMSEKGYFKYENGANTVGVHYLSPENTAAIDKLAGSEIRWYNFAFINKDCFEKEITRLLKTGEKTGRTLGDFMSESYERFRDSGESVLVVVGKRGNTYRGFSKPVTVTTDGYDYRITGVCFIKSDIDMYQETEEAVIFSAVENSGNMILDSSELSVGFKDAAHHEECTGICRDFREANEITWYEDMYIQGTGAGTFTGAILKTAVVFFVFLWLTGIVSMINLTNTRIMNSGREYFIFRCSGMSRGMLVKSVLLETVLFSVISTAVGITAGFVLFAVVSGARSEDMEFIRSIKSAVLPAAGASLLSMAANMIIPVIFAMPLVRRMFSTSSEIVNSNDIR